MFSFYNPTNLFLCLSVAVPISVALAFMTILFSPTTSWKNSVCDTSIYSNALTLPPVDMVVLVTFISSKAVVIVSLSSAVKSSPITIFSSVTVFWISNGEL